MQGLGGMPPHSPSVKPGLLPAFRWVFDGLAHPPDILS